MELLKGTQFPILVLSGWLSTKKTNGFASKKLSSWAKKFRLRRDWRSSISTKYSLLFHQKNSHQIEFQIQFGEINQQLNPSKHPRIPEGFQSQRWKQVPLKRRHVGCFSNSRGFLALSSDDESEEGKADELQELNRIFFTYSSESDEKFYGFGEQFSHVEFKGRRVPILVQEQGIGRGDQPITFAANLVSYRR
ncbi:hypothetical protein HPP92_026735 [Vanilla planifolia]|uniref:Uncharacterized protein n=1 Tax=Vanilla planifolia TaxID=51239 RepID=A0A835PE27_VANPL|nr:hypothetical protein HPP92_026735 [Vanilla planifolia]